jgi:hypothetical protein
MTKIRKDLLPQSSGLSNTRHKQLIFYELSATAIYVGLFPGISERVQQMKLSENLCGAVGEVRTVYYPNSYLVLRMLECLYCMIITW